MKCMACGFGDKDEEKKPIWERAKFVHIRQDVLVDADRWSPPREVGLIICPNCGTVRASEYMFPSDPERMG